MPPQQNAPLEDVFAEIDSTAQSTSPAQPTPAAQPQPTPSVEPASESTPTATGMFSTPESVPPQVMPPLPLQTGAPTPPPVGTSSNTSPSRMRRWLQPRLFFRIGIVVIILGALAYGGLALWQRTQNSTTPIPTIDSSQPTDEVPVTPVNTSTSNSAPQEETADTDSDNDGLSDEEEARYNTDPNTIDTDGDLLNDRQELRVYNTNPTLQDSDGDGYTDGEEVRNFYNPNGPGTLLNVEEEIQQHNAEQP